MLMHLGDDHIHHMRLPVPQAEVALCEPAAFLWSQLDVQTLVDMPVLVAVLM
jgi:hypothetical protein